MSSKISHDLTDLSTVFIEWSNVCLGAVATLKAASSRCSSLLALWVYLHMGVFICPPYSLRQTRAVAGADCGNLGSEIVDFAPWKRFTFTGWEQTSLRHLRDHGNTFEDAACCRIGGKKNNIRFFLKGLCREESHFWWHNLAKHGNFSSKISLLNIYAKSVIISIIILLQHSTW